MRKGEATRQRIVEEAAGIFNRQGFAGTSVQDVMEATGLEKGGIYRYFDSKEELAAEAFRHAMSQAVRLRTDPLEEGRPAVAGAINRLQTAVLRFVETPSTVPGGCPLMNTAIDADDGNAVLRGLAVEGFAAWRARLEAIACEGLASGEIRPHLSPRSIANAIIGALEGGLMLSRLEGTNEALTDAQRALGRLLDGIRA